MSHRAPLRARSWLFALAATTATITIGACGASEDTDPTLGNQGGGGKAAGAGRGGTSAGGEGNAAGGASTNGGAAGTGIVVGTGGSAGSGPPPCAAEAAQADAVELPADIIWVVDQSDSMDQETKYVQQKINDFATAIAKSDVDYRVVMIANNKGSNDVCVPPPLGGANCGNGERFRLVAKKVESTNGPQLALDNFDKYADFIRQNATKHFVFVTDDDSKLSADAFLAGLAAKKPAGLFANVKVHAVFAWGDDKEKGCKGPFGSGARYGSVYEQLVTKTGGAKGVICEDDWTKVFDDVSTAVVSGAKVACELVVPAPPKGKALDPALVNVQYQPGDGGGVKDILRVEGAATCGAAGGWYYDDPLAPKHIVLCPGSCTTVQADPGAKIDVQFGCASVFETPK